MDLLTKTGLNDYLNSLQKHTHTNQAVRLFDTFSMGINFYINTVKIKQRHTHRQKNYNVNHSFIIADIDTGGFKT